MTTQQIQTAFKLYLDVNGMKNNPKSKTFHKAQYWFLAGVRSTTKHGVLPEYIEICHQSGRSILP